MKSTDESDPTLIGYRTVERIFDRHPAAALLVARRIVIDSTRPES